MLFRVCFDKNKGWKRVAVEKMQIYFYQAESITRKNV
jgi:hypothetical protein